MTSEAKTLPGESETFLSGEQPDKDANRLEKRVRRAKIAKNAAYYIFGTLIALFFLFPLVYMLATSTKSESVYAADAGTLRMFLADFAHFSRMADNYKKVFTEYDIWKYALNSLMYAAAVIVLNIVINGLAGYVMAKFDFPGKDFFSFIILFLIVVPVETSIIPLYSIVRNMLGLKGSASVLAVILPASISIFVRAVLSGDSERIRRSGNARRRGKSENILFDDSSAFQADRGYRGYVLLYRRMERLYLAYDGAFLSEARRMAAVSDSGGAYVDSEYSGNHDGRNHGFACGDQSSHLHRVYRGAEIYRAGIRQRRLENVIRFCR